MVYIKVESIYPPHLADEVGKAFIDAMGKFPDDRTIYKPVVRAAVETTTDGFRVTAFYDVKPGKIRKALDLASNRMLIFAKLKGFKYAITTAYNDIEAMKFIGLAAPE